MENIKHGIHLIVVFKNTANIVKYMYAWFLKACVNFFNKFLFFTKWQSFRNYERYFSFHPKSFFRSRDIKFFVFLSSPLFLPVSHCFRDWSKINLKVYDFINCLKKNSITHFVWYLGKEKKYDIETSSNDRALKKEHFYGKIIQKICGKRYSQTPLLFW